jgi:hypothetical protein
MSNRSRIKTWGKFKNRAIFDFLFIEQEPIVPLDPQVIFSLGRYYGIGFSFLCRNFLIEFNLLPLLEYTNDGFF